MDIAQREFSRTEGQSDGGITLTLEDGQQVKLDQILNNQYDLLKWLESAATDLRFLTEDVALKVEAESKILASKETQSFQGQQGYLFGNPTRKMW